MNTTDNIHAPQKHMYTVRAPLTFTPLKQHDILAQLGARHPTPSLGESDLLTTSLFRRAALPEPAPAGTSRAKTVAIIKDVIYNTIHNARRGLEYVGVARAAEPEPSDAYEGMIDQVRKPDYKIRLRA